MDRIGEWKRAAWSEGRERPNPVEFAPSLEVVIEEDSCPEYLEHVASKAIGWAKLGGDLRYWRIQANGETVSWLALFAIGFDYKLIIPMGKWVSESDSRNSFWHMPVHVRVLNDETAFKKAANELLEMEGLVIV